jgi:hypothetical protein
MTRTLIEARTRIYAMLEDMQRAGQPGMISGIDFVECEDGKTIMIYCDVDTEQDAVAIWFDLQPGETFDRHRYSRDFFRPMAIEIASR